MPDLHIDLKQPLSDHQLAFVETSLGNSFRTTSVRQNTSGLEVVHDDAESPDSIKKMVKRLLFIAKSLNQDLVFENKVTPIFDQDPEPYLREVRDVIPVHPGFYTLQGDFLKVFHGINRAVRAIATQVDATEQEYPAVWPIRLFRKIDYFHEFPQQVILCTSVKDDYESRSEFANKYSKNNKFDTVPVDTLMDESEYGLEPAVCDCCYYGLEGLENLNDSYYTCYNKVFRNEKSKTNQLDRLTNFTVRDVMFVGTEDFVLEARQNLIELLSIFITKLQLHAKIETANDPFFANESAMKSVFQNSHRLKYELLAEIPHLGREIAVGSVNFHMDFFGNAFDITASNQKPAFSGCIGVGMERMTYALFSQHGQSLSTWPELVLEYLGVNS